MSAERSRSGICFWNPINTLALLQDHVRDMVPDLYRSSRYTTLEISAALADRQRRRAAAAGHAEMFAVRHGSALEPMLWGGRCEELTYVLLCEVRIFLIFSDS